jgi:hypothetical protein
MGVFVGIGFGWFNPNWCQRIFPDERMLWHRFVDRCRNTPCSLSHVV